MTVANRFRIPLPGSPIAAQTVPEHRHPPGLPGFDEKIVSMYARGMSTREIVGHLHDLYGIDVSPELIGTVTDAVLDEIVTWQQRPLDSRRDHRGDPRRDRAEPRCGCVV